MNLAGGNLSIEEHRVGSEERLPTLRVESCFFWKRGGVGGEDQTSHRQVYRVKGVALFRFTEFLQGEISAPLSVFSLFTLFYKFKEGSLL